ESESLPAPAPAPPPHNGIRWARVVWFAVWAALEPALPGEQMGGSWIRFPPEFPFLQADVNPQLPPYPASRKGPGRETLRGKYKDVEPSLQIKEVDGWELVRQFSEDMESMLGRKVEAVQRLVEAAEEADLNHEFNASLVFDYYNAVLINEKDEKDEFVELGAEFVLEANEHFSDLLVNTSVSNVQLPTNVYNKDPNILNGVYMSEALNPVFVENFQRDPTLTWQYFGSSTGFFRLYPGIKWTPDQRGVISFDCRNRGWYIQAATSPKDIVIVVDVSGSMKGLQMTIAKHTVATILDTLGENDFVNIIAYSDYVHYLEPCFQGILVQADRDNREHFKQLLDELQAKGVGSVSKALREAFTVLQQVRDAGQGALCNQAIMLITDGAVDGYESIFEKYNWPGRKVRVFTYLIGREVSFAANVKWIACNNKGYYTQISTLADVQENVMEYLHVLSRPMVINHDHDIIWTEAYMDSTLFASQAQSLLLMTTVAMPVFSKKNETRSHGILLGVVGSDVPLRELLKLAPRYKLGVHGYAFLNTNNGYILSHPDLQPLYQEAQKLKPKPNYNSVDLSELEWEDRDGTLRTAMINGETGYLAMDVKVPIDKGKRVLFLTNDYFFTDIARTPFSLGVVLSRGHGEYILLGNTSVEEGGSVHFVLSLPSCLRPRIYCITDIDPGHRKLSQLEAVIRFLRGQEPDLQCDEELVQEALFDAVVTAPMEAYWTALALNLSEASQDGVDMAFLGTRAGLMRRSLFVGAEKLSDRKFLTLQDKASIFTMDHFPLWYRRAAEHPAGSFVFSVPSAPGDRTVGYQPGEGLKIIIIIMLLFVKRLLCAESPPLLSPQQDLTCFIIDNNGFIIISKEPHEVPRGCGGRPEVPDTAQCEGGEADNPFQGPPTSPPPQSPLPRSPGSQRGAHRPRKQEQLQPCDTEYPVFAHETSVREAHGVLDCGSCRKGLVAQQVPGSNLLLLVTDAACRCDRFPPVLQEPTQVRYILRPDPGCERLRTQKPRRRPDTCHAFHPEENAEDCGGGAYTAPTLPLLLLPLLLLPP
uniref:Calcium voltage-gated channel auxiliary subunit alpha2delta 4 n=1 Tax=Ornithorhynchus anatinus TaxID=9258 RepID=A0A6I8N129_ORNAN